MGSNSISSPSGISNPGTGVGVDQNELRKLLISKVDKADLDQIVDMKSNKTDTDIVMKGLDIVHKQVTHGVVLIIELIKLTINQMSLQSDSEKSKHHKSMMYIL